MKKRNSITSIITLAILFCMIVGMMAGCGTKKSQESVDSNENKHTTSDNTEKETSSDKPSDSVKLSEEKAELSIWYSWANEYLEDPNEIPAIQKKEEITNVHVNYILISNTEQNEKYGLLLASGELPDIIYHQGVNYPGGLEKSVGDGMFIDLTEYVSTLMPNYRSLIESDPEIARSVKTDSGNYIGIYTLCQNDDGLAEERAWSGYAIRKDWLDKVEMNVPVTIDDWTEVMAAFKNQIGVEYPLFVDSSGNSFGQALPAAYGVTDTFYLEGDTIKYGPAEPGYKEYLAKMAEWYAAGYIDPNFTTVSPTGGIGGDTESIVNGTCGFTPTMTDFLGTGYANMGYEVEEGFYLLPVQNPVLKEGEVSQYRVKPNIVNSTCFGVVTHNCKDVELAVRWMDYNYTEEGMLLNNYGMEGESYTKTEDNAYHLTDLILNNPDGLTASQATKLYSLAACSGNMLGLYNWSRMKDTYAEGIPEIMDTWSKDETSMILPDSISMTDEEGNRFNYKSVDLDTIVKEYTINVITGNQSLDSFDSYVEKLTAAGLTECLEIQQAAYDRYLKR